MLTLIGLGLHDEDDLSLRAIKTAREADKVYIELYTGIWKGSVKNLEKIVRKKTSVLQRSDLEENSEKILNEAKRKKIVLFVQGDPLVATTHDSLLLEARKKKIRAQVIHNASIFSAVGETGLHIYKFGPPVTIPFPEKTKNVLPESIYKTLRENLKRGLHTLCLLDVNNEHGRCMGVNEALSILVELENKLGEGVVSRDEKIVVLADVGGSTKILYKSISELLEKDVKALPAIIIFPGRLHFSEREFLDVFSGV